jgi:hypothetical protein
VSLPTLATSVDRGEDARRLSGGSRGLGRTYFFLAELLLLALDLVALLFALELPLFFEPPELVLDLAMITLLCGRQNRRDEIAVPVRILSWSEKFICSLLVLTEQIGYEDRQGAGLGRR